MMAEPQKTPVPDAPRHASGKCLVTGASGFVGRALCSELARRGIPVRAAVRKNHAGIMPAPEECECVTIGDLSGTTDWSEALRGISVVVHLAARVHVMHESADDPLAEFRNANTAGTERLARQAAGNGIRRLVFVSTVKVNGETTDNNGAFTETDPPCPDEAYSISKWEAEESLHQVARETGLEVVIVRPPLVYGPNVKGNFAALIALLSKRIPLPLASIDNRRSLIFVGNLVDALIACTTHPEAAMQTFLVSDGDDLSTPELLRRLGNAMGKPARLLPVPVSMLRLA